MQTADTKEEQRVGGLRVTRSLEYMKDIAAG